MLQNLTDKFSNLTRSWRGMGTISESNIQDALREVRRALLEADVSLPVIKKFTEAVKEKALGLQVIPSVQPGQLFVKVVQDELTNLLGEQTSELNLASGKTNVIMMVGLQGSGKTTTSAKLALTLKKKGRHPLLVAADIYRPAAIDQLVILGKQISIPVFESRNDKPLDIAKKALEYAKANGNDIVIVDTAGRTQLDESMMNEVKELENYLQPIEKLLVVDAMLGQESVNIANSFNDKLNITGFVLTKMDGDARGGAALSLTAGVGKHIKYMGMGEKIEPLEQFHPDRLASRILGMGDIVSFVEKAAESFDADAMQKAAATMQKGTFTLDDFASQLSMMKNMSSLKDTMKLIPGLGSKVKDEDMEKGQKQMKRYDAILKSMTSDERKNPKKLNSSRKIRIAKGSGTQVQDINLLLKQFEQMQAMMKSLKSMSPAKMMQMGRQMGLK